MKPNTPALTRSLNLWNRLTNPAALRSDDEHRRYRKAARKVRAIINKYWMEGVHYRESDFTGKLQIVPRIPTTAPLSWNAA